MKKLLLSLLMLSIPISSAACGAGSSDAVTSGTVGTTVIQSVTTDRSDSAVTSGATVSDENAPATELPSVTDAPAIDLPPVTDAPADDGDIPTPEVPSELDFEAVKVLDHALCTVTVKEIGYDPIWGYTLLVEIENKSSDTDYTVKLDSAAVNGVQTSAVLYADVKAGKKEVVSIDFLDSALKANGVIEYTDIELTFVVTEEGLPADPLLRETVHVYPYGEDYAEHYVRAPKPTDRLIVDNEYMTVTVTGYEWDDFWGYTAHLYLVNKSEALAMVSIDNVTVNGQAVDPLFATTVLPEKCAFAELTWDKADLDEKGISEVEAIEMTLKVYDFNDWLADDFVNEEIALDPRA